MKVRRSEIYKKGELPCCGQNERCNQANGCENCDICELFLEKVRDNFRE